MKLKKLGISEWIEIIILSAISTGFYMFLLLVLALFFDRFLSEFNSFDSFFIFFTAPLFIVIYMLSVIIRNVIHQK